MNFVVTGGAGFLGSHVVDRLIRAGHQVCVVDDLSTGRVENLNPAASFPGPCACQNIPAATIPSDSIVIHLAAQPRCNMSVFTPVSDATLNYLPGLTFFSNCLRAGVRRFVLVSSMSVYGDAEPLPYNEEMQPKPRDPYGVHKWMLEQVCRIEARLHGMELVVVRPQHGFGSRQRPDLSYRNVVARWVSRAMQQLPLPVFGSLELTRAFSPASLLVRGIVAASLSETSAGQVFNLGSHRVRSLREIAGVIAARLHLPVCFEVRPAPKSLLTEAYGCVDKAEEILGISEAAGEFEENLDALITDIRNWRSKSAEAIPAPELGIDEYASIYGSNAEANRFVGH